MAPADGFVTTSAGSYVFAPTVCAVVVEDGIDDVEIAGAGTAPDGQRVYVTFTSTGNELQIGLGVDQAFATANHTLTGGQYVTQPFAVTVAGKLVRASGIVLANEQGVTVESDAGFEVDCNPRR